MAGVSRCWLSVGRLRLASVLRWPLLPGGVRRAGQQFGAGGAIDHLFADFGQALRIVHAAQQRRQTCRRLRTELPRRLT